MNGELLSILEHIEKEKGIKREVLIEAVESAVTSAARKTLGKRSQGEVTTRLDIQTGALRIYWDQKELDSTEMGRIAAQTAKQVIIQKIREAERDVIYNEFNEKVGSITNGIVHRFERGAVIVDLGRTEAILPIKEQSPKEKYRQGDRVRAYIVEVHRMSKGPQVVLSRTHPGLITRLFELEVPEIYEKIVHIKVVAREAGERAKIAVLSRDTKVDPVGACVGMRGQRVKNVVRELQGERVDIVRWQEDARQFLIEALAPAQVLDIELNEKGKKALVLVEDDQLSLAIGKKGQNVRLASKLTGLEIDIRSRTETLQEQMAQEAADQLDLAQLPGIGPKTKANLETAGFTKVSAIAKASVQQLRQVQGIGERTAQKLIQSAQGIVRQYAEQDEPEKTLDEGQEMPPTEETIPEREASSQETETKGS